MGFFFAFFLSSFLSFHPGIEAFGDLPFRLIARKKILLFLLLLSRFSFSFGRRLEEEGDGFGKLKSLQGISTHPTHSPNCAHSYSSSSLGSRWVVGS